MSFSEEFLRSPTPNFLPFAPPISPADLVPAPGEAMVTLTVPRAFMLTLAGNVRVAFTPGMVAVPKSVADHSYVKACILPRPLRPGDLRPAPGEEMVVAEVLHPCQITIPDGRTVDFAAGAVTVPASVARLLRAR